MKAGTMKRHIALLLGALNARLPKTHRAVFEVSRDIAVEDDGIVIMAGDVETPVSIQIGADGMASVDVWNEAEGAMYHGELHPIRAVEPIVDDVLAGLRN